MTLRELDSSLKTALSEEFGLPVVRETDVDMESFKDYYKYVVVAQGSTVDQLMSMQDRATDIRIAYQAPISFLGLRVLLLVEAR